jgi:hypothetical protein
VDASAGSRDPPTEVALEQHVLTFFQGHVTRDAPLPEGPIHERLPGFRVVMVAPGPRLGMWTYVSIGAYQVRDGEHAQEFIFVGEQDLPIHAAILTITAYYHAGPADHRLGVGHTVPMGKPWMPGSLCNHVLVSLPYPFGPELERCEIPHGHVQFLWLLPITRAEKEFRHRENLEELERRFDEAAIEYWDPARPSVVEPVEGVGPRE